MNLKIVITNVRACKCFVGYVSSRLHDALALTSCSCCVHTASTIHEWTASHLTGQRAPVHTTCAPKPLAECPAKTAVFSPNFVRSSSRRMDVRSAIWGAFRSCFYIFILFYPATDSSAITVCASITRFPLSRPRKKTLRSLEQPKEKAYCETDGQCDNFLFRSPLFYRCLFCFTEVSLVCACRACVWLCLDPTDGHDQKKKEKERTETVRELARACVCACVCVHVKWGNTVLFP